MSDTEYGLAGFRDKDGNLQPVEHSYSWNGEEITIKFRPPTIAEQEELENLDDDAGASELEAVLDRHMVKPQIPDGGSWTTREMWAYLQGIMQHSIGEAGIGEDLDEAIADRSPGGEGN